MTEFTDYAVFAALPLYMLTSLETIEDLQLEDKFFTSIEEIYDLCDQAKLLNNAYKHIQMYGISEPVLETYSTELLESFTFKLTAESDTIVALEGIGEFIKRVYNSIKEALRKLWEWLRTDSYFSRWTNKCERYRVKIGELLATTVRQHSAVNEQTFKSFTIIGHPYSNYTVLLTALLNVTSKINIISSTTKFGDLDIIGLFGADLTKCNFTFENGNMQRPTNLNMKTATLGTLLWNPQKVYATGSNLLALLSKHNFIDRLIYSLQRSIKAADNELNNLIHSTTPDNNTLESLKKELAGLKCIRMISIYTIDVSANLAKQWIIMANRFGTA